MKETENKNRETRIKQQKNLFWKRTFWLIGLVLVITLAFVLMKKYISTSLLEQKYINNLVIKHDEQLNEIFKYFDKTNICS